MWRGTLIKLTLLSRDFGNLYQDDGTPMIACGRCNVWQHLACLQQDEEAETGSVGRSMKDWESVEFVCRSCSQAVLEQDADLVSSAQMSPAAEQHDSIARSVEIEGENEEARVSGVRAPTSPSPVARRVVEMASPASGGEIKVKGKEKARTKVKDKDKAKTLEGKAVEVNAGDAQTPVKKKKSKSTKKSLLEAATAGSIVGTETVAARSETQIPVEHATEVVRTKVKKSKQKEAVAETASRPEGGETMTLDPPPVVDLVPVKPKKVQSVVKDSDIATGAAPMSTVMVGGHLNDGNQVVVKTPKKRKRKTTEEMQAGTAAMPNGEAPPSSEKKHKVRTPKDPAKKAERAERKAAAATATATAVPSSGSFTQTISPNQHSLPIPIGTQQHSPLVSHVPASPHRSSPLPPPPLPHTPPQYGSLNHSPQPQHSQTPPLHLHTLQPMASAIQSSNAVYHHHQTTSPGQYHINGYSSYFSPRPPVPPSLGPVSPYSQQPAPPPPMQRALYPAPPPGSGQQLPPLSTIQSSSGSPASRSPPISLPAYSTFQIAPRPPIMQQPYPMAPPPLASGPYGQQMPPTQFMTSRVPPPQQSVMQFEQRRGSMDMPVNAPIYPPFPSSPSSTPSSMSYDQYHHHQQQQRRASMQDNMVTFVSQNMGAPSSPSQRSPSSGKHQASSTGEPIMMPQRLQYPPTMPVSPQPSQLPRLQQHPSIASAHPHSHGYSHYSYPLPSPTSGRRDSIPNGPPGDDLRPKLQYPPLTIIPQSPKRTAGMSSSGASPRQKKQKVVPADKNATMSGQLPHLGPSLPPPPVLTSDGQIAIPQKGPMHSPKMDIGSLLD
ncbi:hypothetical protein BC936DRAFT_143559 [Jimgerdemannia flammicorona]|uniref:PHD-type domain-containing protein n=1 Tax=Jimgerdemannia flammicorona TaxID=994334 RepID=A0A433DDN0_9FUNG|nr:hypothetical protein BC936DRAFT_143559 [Jimgerdemannia flammicorona]